MDLYNELTEEEKAYHDAMVSIAGRFGPFDQGTSSIWVGYESAEENDDAQIGVKCSNCSLHIEREDGQMGCYIVSYLVEPEAKCRLAAIPDGYVNESMEEEDEEDEEEMDKLNSIEKSIRVGQMVSWNSSGGRAEGKVKRIIRNGSYKVPDSDFTIEGTPDNPAVVIEVYRDGKPTGTMVGHRMNSLNTKKESFWGGRFDALYINKL
jgi:hypothetical protein